jgi:hypothetical protein
MRLAATLALIASVSAARAAGAADRSQHKAVRRQVATKAVRTELERSDVEPLQPP